MQLLFDYDTYYIPCTYENARTLPSEVMADPARGLGIESDLESPRLSPVDVDRVVDIAGNRRANCASKEVTESHSLHCSYSYQEYVHFMHACHAHTKPLLTSKRAGIIRVQTE